MAKKTKHLSDLELYAVAWTHVLATVNLTINLEATYELVLEMLSGGLDNDNATIYGAAIEATGYSATSEGVH